MANLNVIADRLKRGETVTFRPHGHSMTPHIKDGEEVTVRPLTDNDTLKRGMIVLARVHGNMYLHFVRETAGNRVLIGSVHRTNGWTSRDKIFGVKEMIYLQCAKTKKICPLGMRELRGRQP